MKAYRLHLKFLLPLLLLLLLQSGGLWLGIKSLQLLHVVQQEIRTKSNPANTVALTLSKSDFEKYALDNNNELNIEGQMFDVISVETTCDSVSIIALKDAFEERLMALLISTSKSTDQKGSADAFLLALMHLQFISPSASKFEFISRIPKNKSTFSDVKILWDSKWELVLEQPPENKRNLM
jgi:hypothetical protein